MTHLQKLYLDTNILIYLFERHEPFSTRIADTLEEYAQSNGALVTSVITITEFMAGTTGSALTSLKHIPRLEFIVVDETIAEAAAKLQRQSKLSMGDAIHLATALNVRATRFMTNDTQLAKIARKYVPLQDV